MYVKWIIFFTDLIGYFVNSNESLIYVNFYWEILNNFERLVKTVHKFIFYFALFPLIFYYFFLHSLEQKIGSVTSDVFQLLP